MDQTTLPAASGALPWRSPRPQHKPLILFNRAGDAYVFWLESGSHCGKSPEHCLWVDDGGGEQSLDRGPLRRRGPITDVDLFGWRHIHGNISSLSRNDGRDRLHNAMHESRDAVPCAATSLLPSQEHWRAQSVNPDLGLDGAAQAASRHISDASASVSSPRPIPRISRSVQTPLPHRPVVSAVPPRTNTGGPNQGKYQQYRSRSSRPLHRIPQPGQSPSPGRLSDP